MELLKKIAQNLKAVITLLCRISVFPSEESLNDFVSFLFAVENTRENRTDDYCHGPTQVDNDVQVSTTDDNTRSEDEEGLDLNRLPMGVFGQILGGVPYECVFHLKCVSKKLKSSVESSQISQQEKVKLTAPHFFIEHGHWQWAGYDLTSKRWRRMPTLDLNFLPADCRPDPDLFKEFLVCSSHGLLCISFSMSRLIVLNPMSRKYRELPPMNSPRNPVFMHILVNPELECYRVIAAGSANSGDESLSRVTEVYDSRTGKWERTSDVPGPGYALNDFQSGVYQAGTVFCIGFVEDERGQVSKGILGYDVEVGSWRTIKLSSCSLSKSTILQLVELMGEVFLFSERENGQYIDRLDEMEVVNIVHKEKLGGNSLEVYPQSVCVPFGDGRLCILDAVEHTGVVHDIRNQDEFPLVALPDPGFRGELGFFSLNALSFMVEPNFGIKV